MNKKLYAVYLGGRVDRCNIELHDVVFVVGSSIEETYPLLSKKWFGNVQQFHIDSYICLEHMDGHEIHLTKDISKIDPSKKFYFINLGAYKPFEFTEYHQSAFYVSEDAPEAIKRAKSELCQGLETIHKDDVVLLDRVNNPLDFDVDDVMEIREVDEYYITLTPSDKGPSIPISAYIKLDKDVCKVRKEEKRESSSEQCLLKQAEKQEIEAQKFGFYWENFQQLIEQIQSECVEIQEAWANENFLHLQEEVGDLIQASIGLTVFCKLDPRETLLKSIEKFQRRYDVLVQLALSEGYENLHNQSFELLMDYWNRAKLKTKSNI